MPAGERRTIHLGWITRAHRTLGVVVGAAIAAASVVGVASADDISNNVDASIDAAAEIMPLTVGGANGTTQLYVTERNGDGKNGCNLTGSKTLGLSVSSSSTAVATVSPSSLTFGSCGDIKTLTVTPVGPGSATISVSQTSNTTDGTFNLAPATFTVNVSPPPNTAPTVTVGGVTGGASYNKGSVAAATCRVTDAEDGDSMFPATLSAVTGPYASDGIGSQTASCSYTDAGGLTAAASKTYSIIDPSAPTIGYTITPANPDGENGWYKSDVSLAWTVADPDSPRSLVKTGCDDQSITSDQNETTYSCAATSAGGSAVPHSVTIKRDATPPTLDGAASTEANAAGWYNGDVTVQWTAQDGLSGIDPATDPADTVLTDEGTNLGTGEVSVADLAGNVTKASKGGFNIDRTAPGIAWNGAINNGDSFVFGSVPAAPACTATDSLSGPDNCVVSGYSTAVGTHTLTATAHDKAGNEKVESREYTVLAWTHKGFYQPVDMGGVLNTVKNGSTVPLKFEVFAGPTELTNVSAVSKMSADEVNCTTLTNATHDEIEITATGGTSLRYDATAGQFVYNWQTPKKPGSCYRVTMTTQDGSSLTALFKLK